MDRINLIVPNSTIDIHAENALGIQFVYIIVAELM